MVSFTAGFICAIFLGGSLIGTEAAPGADCSGDPTICEAGNNEVCDTGDSNVCVCALGYVVSSGTCVGEITGINQVAGSDVVVTTILTGTADNKATTLTLAENFAAEITITTLTIDGTTTAPLTWAITTTGNVGLLTVNEGVVALAANKAFDFENSPVVTSVITAVDDAATALTATVTLTLSVTDVDEAPVFNPASYAVTIAKDSAAGKVLVTVAATDVDGDTIAYSLSDTGNTNMDWAIGGTTGTIVVATGKTIEEATYTLAVTATSGTPPKTDSATVTVTVNSGAVFGVSLMALFGIILMQLV